MNQETDEHARVREVLERKPGAFEALVRDPDEARDLTQETFLRVHRQLHQFRFESPLKSWIGRIAYSIALRHLERRRATPVSLLGDGEQLAYESAADESFDLEADAGDEQRAGRLLAGIDALPPVPRTLITLYHLEELSIPEIAAMTGMNEGTIKSQLFRARLTLRDWLQRRGVSE